MKEVKKGVMDILLYGIVFVVVQLIVSFLGMLVWSFVQHEELADVRTAMLSGHNPVLLALTSVFSSVITLVVFLKTKWPARPASGDPVDGAAGRRTVCVLRPQ